MAFTGVRGIVSLAAALAIPLETDMGQPFPDRDLIFFLTFSVILVTLVGQGLMLPAVIRALGLAHAGKREQRADRAEEVSARQRAIESAIERLEQLAAQRDLPEDVVHTLRAQHRDRLKHFEHGHDRADGHHEHSKLHDEIESLLIAAERERVNELYRQGTLKDEARRRIERELDLRDASLANHQHEE
jgi:CPA1 family monovalent cation:H+ antiporter